MNKEQFPITDQEALGRRSNAPVVVSPKAHEAGPFDTIGLPPDARAFTLPRLRIKAAPAVLLLVLAFLRAPTAAQGEPAEANSSEGSVSLASRWEVSVHGQIGIPSGYIKVGE